MNRPAERVEGLFYEALHLEAAEDRQELLDHACAGDPELRRAVDAMLERQAAVDRFFSESSPALACAGEISRTIADQAANPESNQLWSVREEEIGKLIGPYRLVQKLGEGGCGSVYLAAQEFPVCREVALKVIKLGMDTKRVISRFEAERQALAMMDHPNIARVLDAGATETGRPYFVMELVRGVKITAYCDEHRLDLRQRLGLFIQVCHAIQHAHQKGIIHRDIKPSNVLVASHEGLAVPKVIDFGIAKATDIQLRTSDTDLTAQGDLLGTPAYMSPEQLAFSEVDVDTRSDIYSLGALLYELLTGEPPFDTDELLKSGVDVMRRILCERDPERPSVRFKRLRQAEASVKARSRGTDPRRLALALSDDLDWIVLKALEKDRRRRYHTASGMASDIERHLANEPVTATPPTQSYRLRKLVRRNRTTFAGIAAVSLALITALAVSSWMFVREREARQESERARSAETGLRQAAEAREKVALAAYLFNRGKITEADQLVTNVHLQTSEPSMEAAVLFRALGDWHVAQGHWKAAADRLLNMVRASELDKTDMTDEATRDLLRVGPVLVIAGKTERYYGLRKDIVQRFSQTDNEVAAEQVLKLSLILPADEKMLTQLGPSALIVQRSLERGEANPKNPYMVAWRAFSAALFEYRAHNYRGAISWCRRGLDSPDMTPTRVAMTHLLLAMALSKDAQADLARKEFAAGKAMIISKFPNKEARISSLGTAQTGLWWDWLLAYILYQEAAPMFAAGN